MVTIMRMKTSTHLELKGICAATENDWLLQAIVYYGLTNI